MSDWRTHPWSGVFAATLVPFLEDESIDAEGLRSYIDELASVQDIVGLTCNGHTGEIMALRHSERAQVTKIVSETVKGRCKVISGVAAEGSLEAIDDAIAAKEAGADAALSVPADHVSHAPHLTSLALPLTPHS